MECEGYLYSYPIFETVEYFDHNLSNLCANLFLNFCLGKSREAEVKRINKELANIRSKFKGKTIS